jgi:hypothetical protein
MFHACSTCLSLLPIRRDTLFERFSHQHERTDIVARRLGIKGEGEGVVARVGRGRERREFPGLVLLRAATECGLWLVRPQKGRGRGVEKAHVRGGKAPR